MHRDEPPDPAAAHPAQAGAPSDRCAPDRQAALRSAEAGDSVPSAASQLLLLRFHAVAVLDGAEVLPAIDHDQPEEQRHGAGKDAHLRVRARIGGLHQAGIVEALDEEDFGRGSAPRALLRRKQRLVALRDPVLRCCGRTVCIVSRDCLCRHRLLPTAYCLISYNFVFLSSTTGPGSLIRRKDYEVRLILLSPFAAVGRPRPDLFATNS